MSGPLTKLRLLIVLACLVFPVGATAFDHSIWGGLLNRFVSPTTDGGSTAVDYGGLQEHRTELREYLDQLSRVDPAIYDAWPAPERLAFLLNAYNAWTVELILDHYPELVSIKDIGGWLGSPWKKAIAPLLGETRTLDEIEHDMIRGSGEFEEPRIHFAVNCASIGCPALRAEAYVADRLEKQLDAQTRAFLADRSRNAWRGDALHLSPIFKWYREDFEAGWRGLDSLTAFINHYADALDLTPDQREAVLDGRTALRYTEYDWRLNDVRQTQD